MKRSILFIVLSMCVVSAFAQVLSTVDAALVYYMPKTLLAFEVNYVETTRTQGPFYQYAERYLGAKDVVTEDETVFELSSVAIHTKTIADKERAFTFNPSRSQQADLTLNKQGLLVAYNAEAPEEGTKNTSFSSKGRSSKDKKQAEDNLTPFTEEMLLATSKAKMAESTAKQIYRLREARVNILAGDVDHLPADGRAMELTLKELDEQEAKLVKLFTGTVETKHLHKLIYVEPTEDESRLLLRFSRFAGPVETDNLSGEPIKVELRVMKQELKPAGEKEKAPALSDIYYNLPGEVDVKVTDATGKMLAEKTLPVAQFGVSVALTKDLINRKPRIIFDTQTGAILSISEANK